MPCFAFADYDLPDFKNGQVLEATHLQSIVTAVTDLSEKSEENTDSITLNSNDIKTAEDAINLLHDDVQPNPLRYFSLGDSITSTANSWADKLNTSMNFETYENIAVGGATAVYDPKRGRLINQVNQVTSGTTLITVLIGINDWAVNHTLGDATNTLAKDFTTLTDTTNFCDAFRLSMETLKRKHPNARIYIVTPLQTTQKMANTDSFPLTDFRTAIIKIASYLSIPVIRADEESGIWAYDPSKTLMPDGVHPNEKGSEVLAAYVERKIRSM